MTAHLFGGNWIPSCCNFALRHTAQENKDLFGWDADQRVIRNFYVDDWLMSVKSEDDAITTVVADMKLMWFETKKFQKKLTSWYTN